jgi:hypothetical protein
MKHVSTDSYDEFIAGFAEAAPILTVCDAEKEWDDFSQQLQLSIEEIVALEEGGFVAGIELGKRYRKLHPLQRMD